jgi:PQQ-like domain
MDFAKPVDLASGLELPLNRAGWIDGQTEHGPSAPKALIFQEGVLVSRRKYISFHSHDLKQELWSHTVPGWTGFIATPQGTVIQKPETSIVTEYELKTGSVKRAAETNSQAILVGCSAESFLLMSLEDSTLSAFDWTARKLWNWKFDGFCNFVSSPDKYIVVESGTKLRVFGAMTGQQLWDFEAEKTSDKSPQDRSNVFVSAFPSVVIFGKELMAIAGDGRIFKFDLDSGKILKTGHTPFRGPFQVSKNSIFILSMVTGEFSQFDHRKMREIKREDLKETLRVMFQGNPVTINAILVSEETLFWTTMQGSLMGLEREAKGGRKRKAWADPLGNVAMPIGIPPLCYPGYMYYTVISTDPKVPKGLICYRPAD